MCLVQDELVGLPVVQPPGAAHHVEALDAGVLAEALQCGLEDQLAGAELRVLLVVADLDAGVLSPGADAELRGDAAPAHVQRVDLAAVVVVEGPGEVAEEGGLVRLEADRRPGALRALPAGRLDVEEGLEGLVERSVVGVRGEAHVLQLVELLAVAAQVAPEVLLEPSHQVLERLAAVEHVDAVRDLRAAAQGVEVADAAPEQGVFGDGAEHEQPAAVGALPQVRHDRRRQRSARLVGSAQTASPTGVRR